MQRKKVTSFCKFRHVCVMQEVSSLHHSEIDEFLLNARRRNLLQLVTLHCRPCSSKKSRDALEKLRNVYYISIA